MQKIIHWDCLEVLRRATPNSIDAIVTDPPYELGFMGKSWDSTGIANNVELWKECLRVLKPGGHLLAFSGTRTYHRMASAIEDAGFEVRDMIEWVYWSWFPKSLNVFKALTKKCSCGNMEVYENRIKQKGESSEQETEYFLRFMQQADLSETVSFKKERGEVLQSCLSEQSSHRAVQGGKPKESSQGGEERILEGWNNTEKTEGKLQGGNLSEMSEGISANGEKRRIHNATQISDGSIPKQIANENGSGASQRPQSEQQQYTEPCAFCKQWGTQAIRSYGVGSNLKPAHEPICMARKPLEQKTVAENCLKWGTGGINIDESRVDVSENDLEAMQKKNDSFKGANNKEYNGIQFVNKDRNLEVNTLGRFPANLIHDNSEEVRECFPETVGAGNKIGTPRKSGTFFTDEQTQMNMKYDNGGSTARFFKSIIYQAKASKSERNEWCEELDEKQSVGGWGGVGDYLDDVNSASGKFGSEKAPAKNNHPTVKPVALMEYLIKMVTREWQIVLDPFAGSGTTLVACKNLGRWYVGIEREEEYIKIINARLWNTLKNTSKLRKLNTRLINTNTT